MIREELFEKVKMLFNKIIDNLDTSDKKKHEYQVILPKFVNSTQISSKSIKKYGYSTLLSLLEEFKKLEEFQEIIKLVQDNINLPQEKIEKLIQEFLKFSLNKCREKSCEKEIEYLIEYLYNDLMKNPFVYTIKSYLLGIELEDDSYKIRDDLIIRKANSFDFECNDIGEYNNMLQSYSFQFPPVILEYTFISNYYNEYIVDYTRPQELGIEMSFIDIAFILFRCGPVFRNKTISKINSIFPRESITTGFTPRRTTEKYFISKDHVKDLKKIFKIFQDEEIRKIFYISNKKSKFLQIALNRYQNSYLFAENREQRITSLISCLEALFSVGGQELKRSLSQKVSIILKAIGYNPLNIFENISLAYNIRNNYSHGSVVNLREKLKGKDNFLKNLYEFTRLCLLISIQINKIMGKKKWLKLIDQALLDDQSFEGLVNLIKHNCNVFKV